MAVHCEIQIQKSKRYHSQYRYKHIYIKAFPG